MLVVQQPRADQGISRRTKPSARPLRYLDGRNCPSAAPASILCGPEQLTLSGGPTEFLKRKPRLLTNGDWVEGRGQARIPAVDPATERQIAEVADADDADRAVRAARTAFTSGPWAEMLPDQRERLMWRLTDLMELHASALAELASLDMMRCVRVACPR